jgi:deoxyadenosine/deoxycytidine kinase
LDSKIFIVLAGNIGTGKTTLTRMLSERFGWSPRYESVSDNPYLSDFYSDMSRWTFTLQVYFLTHRFKTHQNILNSTESAIQDRSIYEDAHIFARSHYESGIMSARDYQNYRNLYDTMVEFLKAPDLVVYLKKSTRRLKEQIRIRGREYEKSISDEYLSTLNRYYNEWIEGYPGKKLVIDSDDLDFVKNPKDFDKISDLVLAQLDQKDLFIKPRCLKF